MIHCSGPDIVPGSWCSILIKRRFPRTTPSDRGGFYNTHSNAFYFSRASATNFFIHFVRGLPTLINRAAIPPEIAANTFYSTTPHRDMFYIGASSRIRIAHGGTSPLSTRSFRSLIVSFSVIHSHPAVPAPCTLFHPSTGNNDPRAMPYR